VANEFIYIKNFLFLRSQIASSNFQTRAERSANWLATINIRQFAIVRIKLNSGKIMVFAAGRKGFTFTKRWNLSCDHKRFHLYKKVKPLNLNSGGFGGTRPDSVHSTCQRQKPETITNFHFEISNIQCKM